MRILLFGKGGQLGWEACRTLACLGDVIALDAPEVDFTQPEGVRQLVTRIKPDVIFNAAAYTAVDKAETEVKKARLINAIAPGVLADVARQVRAVLVHFSTDYVFDGQKAGPYLESDVTAPLNVYGQTKLEGEWAVLEAGGAGLVLRTAWVYSLRPESFVGKVLSWSRQNPTLKIVADQTGSPTWARLLAEASGHILAQGKEDLFEWGKSHAGIYHLAGEGVASRYDWAKEILALDPCRTEQICSQVLPALTADFPTAALRPLHTALDSSRFYQTFGIRLGEWQNGLRLALS